MTRREKLIHYAIWWICPQFRKIKARFIKINVIAVFFALFRKQSCQSMDKENFKFGITLILMNLALISLNWGQIHLIFLNQFIMTVLFFYSQFWTWKTRNVNKYFFLQKHFKKCDPPIVFIDLSIILIMRTSSLKTWLRCVSWTFLTWYIIFI